jgi:LDH2 family malate/lactate/ureidoglycolate dehydrogenase
VKVSFNELQALSRKAFTGIGFAEGHADDAADMVTWMESYDLHGLEALNLGLEHLIEADPSVRPEILYQDGDLAVVDGHNLSVLRASNLALELAFAKARSRGLSVIKIRRCRQRQLIMGYLARLSARGMNVTAFWRNAHRPLTEQVVGFRANSTVPSIRVYAVEEVPEENEPNDGVTLVMANHVDLLPTMRSDYRYDLLAKHEESDLLAVRERAMSSGIEVAPELWLRLKELAQITLVESFDASRLGAGPAE